MVSMWSECIPYIARVVRVYPIYCPCGQRVSHVPYQFMVSTWSERLTMRGINSCCLHGRYVLPYIALVRAYPIYCPCSSVSQCAVSIHGVHVVNMYPTYRHARYQFTVSMPYQFMVSMWSEWIPYIAHVVGASHHAQYQFMVSTWSDGSHILSMWSECITMHRIDPCCLDGQTGSPYAVSIHAVYMVRRCPIYCPCGRCVSPCAISIHGIHVAIVYPIYCPYGQSVSNILPIWSECLTMRHIDP